jgi:hypothetical protein
VRVRSPPPPAAASDNRTPKTGPGDGSSTSETCAGWWRWPAEGRIQSRETAAEAIRRCLERSASGHNAESLIQFRTTCAGLSRPVLEPTCAVLSFFLQEF